MDWMMQILAAAPGPVFHERLYDAVGALIVFIVGMALVMKAGKAIGWLFVACAVVWAYMTFKDLMM